VYIQTFVHDYLRTMVVPLLRGRWFNAHDTGKSPPVVIINQAFARRFFAGLDPVGKHVSLGRRGPSEIVGVVGDVKNASLTADPAPEVDLPFAQLPWPSMNLTVRTDGDPRVLAGAIRAQIASVDRDVPVIGVQTLDEVLSTSRAQPRAMMVLLAVFAGCAFVLAVVGLYGVISYSVTQRTREMGVRIALGASRASVIGLVVRHGLLLAAVGITAGIAVSFAATRLMASMMYGVSTTDPLTFVVSPLVFLLFAALASAIPAMRATRVDPSEALRAE
jgi:putative ABC transport system permease protein